MNDDGEVSREEEEDRLWFFIALVFFAWMSFEYSCVGQGDASMVLLGRRFEMNDDPMMKLRMKGGRRRRRTRRLRSLFFQLLASAPMKSLAADDADDELELAPLTPWPAPLVGPLPCVAFSCSLSSLMAWISFLSFIRRFWNQILICRSVRHRACAISMRRRRVR